MTHASQMNPKRGSPTARADHSYGLNDRILIRTNTKVTKNTKQERSSSCLEFFVSFVIFVFVIVTLTVIVPCYAR